MRASITFLVNNLPYYVKELLVAYFLFLFLLLCTSAFGREATEAAVNFVMGYWVQITYSLVGVGILIFAFNYDRK